MSIHIDSLQEIENKLGIQNNGPAEAFMTATCAKAMDKYVPFDTGTLAETVVVNGEVTNNVKQNRIIYSQKYAEYVYKGLSRSGNKLHYHTDKHGYAGPYWDKRMVSAEMNKIVKQVENYIRRKK